MFAAKSTRRGVALLQVRRQQPAVRAVLRLVRRHDSAASALRSHVSFSAEIALLVVRVFSLNATLRAFDFSALLSELAEIADFNPRARSRDFTWGLPHSQIEHVDCMINLFNHACRQISGQGAFQLCSTAMYVYRWFYLWILFFLFFAILN